MRRCLLSLLLLALFGATAVPAMAQSGGAAAPDPDAPPSGGRSYDRNAGPVTERPVDKPAKRPVRKPAGKRKVTRRRSQPPVRPVRTRPAPAPAPSPPSPKGHRFPLIGAFTFGGKDSRFGASRRGHTHQGQDVAAAEGTPVVAPRTGTVEVVRYQASGAGHYIVLDGDGEDRDYVFMHLRTGSIVVTEGQKVRIGAPLGQVGNTGVSFGAHLHFEVWVGGWYAGGNPIDPLPLLRAWPRA